MLKFFAVEKNAAYLLMIFAVAGLLLANSPVGVSFNHFAHEPVQFFATLSLSPADLTGEFLMTGFFLLVGLELKCELTSGVFRNRAALLIPSFAAVFGAIVPALIFAAFNFNDPDASRGWGIPMATDLTFALAVFSIFGRKIPSQGRTFVLAFAVIDDLIAIAVIAIFISTAINFVWLLGAAVALVLFWLAGRFNLAWLMVILALLAWYLLYQSGVQPAVSGVVLGLLVAKNKVSGLEDAVHPWVSLLILPIFALFATAVNLGSGFSLLAPVALAVLLRPIGKIVGINFGVWLAGRITKVKTFEELTRRDYLALSTLGGIGFSVALLIANQTFGAGSDLATQAVIATLIAMLFSAALAAFALTRKRA